MSDQDLAAQVEQLRARQEQTDQSLVTLTQAIEALVEEAKASPTFSRFTDTRLGPLSQRLATVKQAHQSNLGR